MDKFEFGKCMAPLVAAIGKPIAAEQARVYFEMLQDLPVSGLEVGVKRALCEHEFATIPSIATLRRLALETHSEADYVIASEMVLSARRHAFYEPEKAREMISDPKAMAAMEAIGGLSRLADLTADTIGTYAAQFRQAYLGLQSCEQKANVRAVLESGSHPAIAGLARAIGTEKGT